MRYGINNKETTAKVVLGKIIAKERVFGTLIDHPKQERPIEIKINSKTIQK